jgi:mono/diheme cytochrome c family protein
MMRGNYVQQLFCCLALGWMSVSVATANEEANTATQMRLAQADSVAPPSSSETPKKKLDVKNVFRNICGFCHENYGRVAAKGPQLMSSERTDEFLFNRIKNGLPGRMAAWGSIFDDEQIRLIVKFIRSLKPDEDPQNP